MNVDLYGQRQLQVKIPGLVPWPQVLPNLHMELPSMGLSCLLIEMDRVAIKSGAQQVPSDWWNVE